MYQAAFLPPAQSIYDSMMSSVLGGRVNEYRVPSAFHRARASCHSDLATWLFCCCRRVLLFSRFWPVFRRAPCRLSFRYRHLQALWRGHRQAEQRSIAPFRMAYMVDRRAAGSRCCGIVVDRPAVWRRRCRQNPVHIVKGNRPSLTSVRRTTSLIGRRLVP